MTRPRTGPVSFLLVEPDLGGDAVRVESARRTGLVDGVGHEIDPGAEELLAASRTDNDAVDWPVAQDALLVPWHERTGHDGVGAPEDLGRRVHC